MAKKKRSRAPQRASPSAAPARTPAYRRALLPALLFLAVLACYWTPLTSPNASIQWDAADQFQVFQDYFSSELRAGHLPFWTPYVFSGFPFLADPQAGVWYPLNWPFFLAGVSPASIQVELFLHALIACFGAYLLARQLLGDALAAVVAGFAYGLSGFFVGHASHVPMVQAAAWLPWLLLLFLRAGEARAVLHTTLGALAAGLMILAGHFQTALYGFSALGLVVVFKLIAEPRRWRGILARALVVVAGGALLAAVGVLPGLELTTHSIRTTLSAIKLTDGMIPLPSLLTLLYPDYYGALAGNYRGPEDISQYYFYAGLLTVPLALAGLRNAAVRWIGLLLLVPALWYAAGRSAGLYLLVARLPGFRSIRAPVNIWFVPALGLALLAGAGLLWLRRKWPVKWLPALVLAVLFADVWYSNSYRNPLLYARASYDELYGSGANLFLKATSALPPLSRFHGAARLPAFGPMNYALTARVETTYGYNPLALTAYDEYLVAVNSNPKLKNGLGVSRYLDAARSQVLVNPEALSRVYFPKRLIAVSSGAETRRALATLEPAEAAIVPARLARLSQDPAAQASVADYSGDRYLVRYRARSASLLRIASPWFPGWTARAGGEPLEVVRVDHALMGVVVPPGEGELLLEYRSSYFALGAAISLATAALCLAAAVVAIRRREG